MLSVSSSRTFYRSAIVALKHLVFEKNTETDLEKIAVWKLYSGLTFSLDSTGLQVWWVSIDVGRQIRGVGSTVTNRRMQPMPLHGENVQNSLFAP